MIISTQKDLKEFVDDVSIYYEDLDNKIKEEGMYIEDILIYKKLKLKNFMNHYRPMKICLKITNGLFIEVPKSSWQVLLLGSVGMLFDCSYEMITKQNQSRGRNKNVFRYTGKPINCIFAYFTFGCFYQNIKKNSETLRRKINIILKDYSKYEQRNTIRAMVDAFCKNIVENSFNNELGIKKQRKDN